MDSSLGAPPRRFHYAWVMMAVTFLVLLVAAGIRSMPGVLILPLEAEFGWDRATISLAAAINLFLFGFFGPFASAIMERFGMKTVMTCALLTIVVALGLTTLMRDAWQLHALWGLVIGTGVGALSGWIVATVANRWFVERRGLATGLLTIGNTMGQMTFLPLLASLILALGWRSTSLIAAGMALLVIPLVLLFIRDHPQEVGLRPYGATGDPPPASAAKRTTGNPFVAAVATLRDCLGDRNFWLLSGSFFVCGASANGLIGTHLIPASVEHGMPEVTAASLLAGIGAFSVVGAILSGWLSDRFDNRRLLAVYYGLRGLALLFLPLAFDVGAVGLALFIIFDGLDWSATGPPTVRLTADLFGRARAGTVYAWISASHQLGAASVALGAGALRTWLGDYQASFILAGVLCQVAVLLVLRIGPSAPTERLPARSPAEEAVA